MLRWTLEMFHGHKGLVLALLSALYSTYTCKYPHPCENALNPPAGDEERVSGTNFSPRRPATPHPQGISAVINIKPIGENLT